LVPELSVNFTDNESRVLEKRKLRGFCQVKEEDNDLSLKAAVLPLRENVQL
jgi:hypothetical protein